MSPKPKPEEKPVWVNFTLLPTEKERWKVFAQKEGCPLATFIKKEINQVVDEYFKKIVVNLKEFNGNIVELAVIKGATHVDLYDKVDYIKQAVNKIDDFFNKHVKQNIIMPK